jgi:hypothetical protein
MKFDTVIGGQKMTTKKIKLFSRFSKSDGFVFFTHDGTILMITIA